MHNSKEGLGKYVYFALPAVVGLSNGSRVVACISPLLLLTMALPT